MKNKYEIRGEVTAIFICYKGVALETIIDSIDLSKANEYTGKWGARWNQTTKTFYVYGNTSRLSNPKTDNERGRGAIALHRWLMDTPDHLQVDHFDHDSLNNKRSSNLRNATQFENKQNAKGPHSSKKSDGGLNVYPDKQWNSWKVSSRINGKTKHLGSFSTKEEAETFAINYRAQYLPFSKDAKFHKISEPVTDKLNPHKAYNSNKGTGVRGVLKRRYGSYVAVVQHKKKRITLGYFTNIEDAEQIASLARERILSGKPFDDLIYDKDNTPRKNGSSGVRGVHWGTKEKKWRGSFDYKGQHYYLGYFETVEEAANAVREAREQVKKEAM